MILIKLLNVHIMIAEHNMMHENRWSSFNVYLLNCHMLYSMCLYDTGMFTASFNIRVTNDGSRIIERPRFSVVMTAHLLIDPKLSSARMMWRCGCGVGNVGLGGDGSGGRAEAVSSTPVLFNPLWYNLDKR